MTATSVFTVLAGVWIALTPLFAPDLPAYAATSDVATGAAVAVLASIRLLMPRRTAPLGVLLTLLGAWLVAAPFVLGYGHHPAAAWNNIVVGVLVTMFAGVSVAAMLSSARHMTAEVPPTARDRVRS
ncbi:SPW repeat protein [Actinoplanes sp. NPDC048796]|uniref:SPW repeat protein n=1 Tax=Actinoplanes sp. NPDC048796 TaxID=3155640 RepID=UPI0033C7C0BE